MSHKLEGLPTVGTLVFCVAILLACLMGDTFRLEKVQHRLFELCQLEQNKYYTYCEGERR